MSTLFPERKEHPMPWGIRCYPCSSNPSLPRPDVPASIQEHDSDMSSLVKSHGFSSLIFQDTYYCNATAAALGFIRVSLMAAIRPYVKPRRPSPVCALDPRPQNPRRGTSSAAPSAQDPACWVSRCPVFGPSMKRTGLCEVRSWSACSPSRRRSGLGR